jgi:hypothetical protein
MNKPPNINLFLPSEFVWSTRLEKVCPLDMRKVHSLYVIELLNPAKKQYDEIHSFLDEHYDNQTEDTRWDFQFHSRKRITVHYITDGEGYWDYEQNELDMVLLITISEQMGPVFKLRFSA